MFLILTRAFPPELGGMQSLMWGLTKEMSRNFMVKVFADYQKNHKEFDKKENFSIERVGGIKLLRKYRKAQFVNEFVKQNKIKNQNYVSQNGRRTKSKTNRKDKSYASNSGRKNHP